MRAQMMKKMMRNHILMKILMSHNHHINIQWYRITLMSTSTLETSSCIGSLALFSLIAQLQDTSSVTSMIFRAGIGIASTTQEPI